MLPPLRCEASQPRMQTRPRPSRLLPAMRSSRRTRPVPAAGPVQWAADCPRWRYWPAHESGPHRMRRLQRISRRGLPRREPQARARGRDTLSLELPILGCLAEANARGVAVSIPHLAALLRKAWPLVTLGHRAGSFCCAGSTCHASGRPGPDSSACDSTCGGGDCP